MFGFFKPKWQHRNPKIRIEAVNNNLEKDLILKIAQTDKDVDVRMAAFMQIDELNLLYAIVLQEPCDHGRKAALEQIIAVFTQDTSPKTSIHNFMETTVRRGFPFADLLMVCRDPKIKQLLFPLINLQKDLPKLVEENYPFTVDELLLVDNIDVLTSLVKRANITDKKVLMHLKNAIQKQESIEQKILLKASLLEKYQALAVSEPLMALNVFSEVENDWNAYELGEENQEYRNAYLARYHAYNAERQTDLASLKSIEDSIDQNNISDYSVAIGTLQTLVESTSFSVKEKNHIRSMIQILEAKRIQEHQQQQVDKNADELLKKANAVIQQIITISPIDLEKLKSAITQLPKNYPQRSEALNALTQEKLVVKENNHESVKITSEPINVKAFDQVAFQNSLQKLEALIEEGQLQRAEQLNKELFNLLKTAEKTKEANRNQRLLKQVAQPLLDQLDNARWGMYQNLELLCDKAEQLAGQGSIELISVTLKQLREDWNESKKGLGRVPQRLYQRFENACKQAHQRLVDERTQDNTARAQYLEEANELLTNLSQFVQQIDWQQPDWNNLIDVRQRFLNEWNRYLNQYSTDGVLSYGAPLFLMKDKQKLERLMRQILKPLDVAVQNERTKEKKRREDEIEQLQLLLNERNIREAVDKAKLFNRTFNPTIRSKRQDENVLWKQLRLVNDQIFALREEYVSAEENEKNANAQKKRELLVALQSLQANTELAANEVYEALSNLEDAWLAVGVVPKNVYGKLDKEFKNIQQAIKHSLENAELQKEQAQREELLATAQTIAQLESLIVSGESINIESSLYDQADAQLRKRLKCLEQILAGQKSALDYLTQQLSLAEILAHELVLTREILLDQPSPEEDKNQRLAMQVSILEQAMTANRNDKDKQSQLKRLDERWLENVVGNVNEALYQRFR